MIKIHINSSVMKTKKNILSLAIAIAICGCVSAKEDIGKPAVKPSAQRVMSNGCPQDLGASFLQLNNVRVRIMDEGDMWWDPGQNLQEYVVPKNGVASSEFAGSLWIGGLDAGGQLKISCMTYRQNGEDFWAGPLDTTNASISLTECQKYDKLYYVTRQEVVTFVANPVEKNAPPTDIANWPGNGDATYHESTQLAPYVDVNHDGQYLPSDGDYPAYDLTGSNVGCQNELYGDATLWWVFNDEGNIHSETNGIAIGLEIRAQAFEFQTNDAVNNCTFYNYEIINRSTYSVNQTYFGAWNDFDLGNGGDDYTGCDVSRNMGYGYNGEQTDPDGSGPFAGEKGYHNYPPAIGEVFFKGPVADKKDTSCYVHAGLIGMAHFVYYVNDFSVTGNPQNSSHYYNYLRSLWTDGTPMTYGGNGYQTSSTLANYMFDWTPAGVAGPAANTDLKGCGTGGVVQNTAWDESDAHTPFGDRRFLESAGPFTLQPGAVNYVTTGLVWDQSATSNNNLLPIALIQQDADLAQALFNSCFLVLDGPDAPDLTIQELNQELIITISNASTSNNYKEGYSQVSSAIQPEYKDNTFKFQGYQIFQVVDSAITANQLNDPTVARLVAECDIQDGVGQIVNYNFSPVLNTNVPVLEVNGADKGIVHSFDLKSDLFQIDNIPNLVNDRPYYYLAVAYAYNNYTTYNPNNPGPKDSLLKGQKMPYLQGSHNVKVYAAVPHIPEAQSYGTVQNSTYGETPEVTRIEGHGNGFNVIDLNQASINYILQNDSMAHPTYAIDQAPINIKVVDPLNVLNANFVVKILPGAKAKGFMDSTARWEIYVAGGKDTIKSDTTIGVENEQVIPQWGISAQIQDVDPPGAPGAINNSSLQDSISFADPTKAWLSGVQNATPGINLKYWVRSGNFTDNPLQGGTSDGTYTSAKVGANFADPNGGYQQVISGTWGPYILCGISDPSSSPPLYCDNGPRLQGDQPTFSDLSSVDVFITADKSKWTRCPVLEEQDQMNLTEGGKTPKLSPRSAPSVDKDGNPATVFTSSTDPTKPNYISATGMGWFPGYAINVETGERLNMAFGEDSWLVQDNGRDMLWNPDSIETRQNGTGSNGAALRFGEESVFGGKHYIYVFGHNNHASSVIPIYDAGAELMKCLDSVGNDK